LDQTRRAMIKSLFLHFCVTFWARWLTTTICLTCSAVSATESLHDVSTPKTKHQDQNVVSDDDDADDWDVDDEDEAPAWFMAKPLLSFPHDDAPRRLVPGYCRPGDVTSHKVRQEVDPAIMMAFQKAIMEVLSDSRSNSQDAENESVVEGVEEGVEPPENTDTDDDLFESPGSQAHQVFIVEQSGPPGSNLPGFQAFLMGPGGVPVAIPGILPQHLQFFQTMQLPKKIQPASVLSQEPSDGTCLVEPKFRMPWNAPAELASRNHSAEQIWRGPALEVREAFLHAWKGYTRYAWGRDELRPLSRTGTNPYGGLGMSILDSLTTLLLFDLSTEFEHAMEFVRRHLVFGAEDPQVSVFELTIRALGGLLGAHSLSGRHSLLRRARELAERLLPTFNTTSGLPLHSWNLRRWEDVATSNPCILSEVGSIQVEWRHLSVQTGDVQFQMLADRAFAAIQAGGVKGILPVHLTPPHHVPPRPIESKFSVGGRADSYYEYLLKQWIQTGDNYFKDLFFDVMRELPVLIRPSTGPGPYRIIEIDGFGQVRWKMEHLSCFVPGTIALALLTLPEEDLSQHRAQWFALAEGITASCVEMWTSTPSGLAPEHVHVNHDWPRGPLEVPEEGKHSLLRPETVESLFYMFVLTRDEKYRRWGEQIFSAIWTHGRLPSGFATVADVRVVPTVKVDEMHSFLLAETFKYLYLLFSPPGTLDISRYVMNTEGHPLSLKSCGGDGTPSRWRRMGPQAGLS